MLDNIYDNINLNSQVSKGSSSTDSSTKIAGGNVQLKGDFQKCGIATLGFMSEDDVYDATGFKINNFKKKVGVDVNQDFQLYSALFQYEISPIPHLGLVGGAGLHEQQRVDGSNENYSYQLGAHYDLFEGTRLKANYSRKVRFPTLRDLYDPVSGNPALVPETTLNYEAGIEQNLPAKTMLSVTGFIIDAHNFIEVFNSPTGGQGFAENFDTYRFRGFEVSAENRLIRNLLARASYSFLHSENDSPGIHATVLQYRPQDKVTLEGTYRLPCGTTLNASLVYVANQFDIGQDNVSTLKMPAYTVMDVKINQSLMNNSVDLYIGVRNLLNADYAENFAYPQAGRTLYGGVGYRF
jgi:outer membrane cobalamin receptor